MHHTPPTHRLQNCPRFSRTELFELSTNIFFFWVVRVALMAYNWPKDLYPKKLSLLLKVSKA